MNTLQDLLNWHEAQRRLAMMAQMSSSEALARAQSHDQAIALLKRVIAEQQKPSE